MSAEPGPGIPGQDKQGQYSKISACRTGDAARVFADKPCPHRQDQENISKKKIKQLEQTGFFPSNGFVLHHHIKIHSDSKRYWSPQILQKHSGQTGLPDYFNETRPLEPIFHKEFPGGHIVIFYKGRHAVTALGPYMPEGFRI